jgi:hypothetical protein
MYRRTKFVEPLPGHKLLVAYVDGEQRVFDVTPYLNDGVFAQLRDASVFSSVHVAFDSVQWDNGADICPEVLYEESVPYLPAKVAEERVPYAKDSNS